jgi:hypothetical protein
MDGFCILPYRMRTSYSGAVVWWSITAPFSYICNLCRWNAGFRNTKILNHRSCGALRSIDWHLRSYWRLGRTCLLHRQGSNSGGRRRPIKIETIGYSEKSATHRHCTLRNNPEEWRTHLHRCRSLKSRTPRLNPNAQLLLSWCHVPYRCDTGCHPFRLQSSKINIYMNWQFIASCKMCQNLVSQPLRQN